MKNCFSNIIRTRNGFANIEVKYALSQLLVLPINDQYVFNFILNIPEFMDIIKNYLESQGLNIINRIHFL